MKLFLRTLQLTCLVLVAMSGGFAQHRNQPIAVGDVAPDFTLEDQNRQKVTLSSARSKYPVVIVFYRGYW